ncbi:MAG: hypothetical protein HYV39_03000 [Candidatus Levybacteria bacterium]|nr:hypothetical protein [Candidatus Levybacteria bacterium]
MKSSTLKMIMVLIVGWYLVTNGVISKNDNAIDPTSTPAEAGSNAAAVQTAVENVAQMTPTPGSAGAGQMETAVPTQTIIVDLGDANKMIELMQGKMTREMVNWLITARLSTGGGAHACFVAWYDEPFDDITVPAGHPGIPMWQVIDGGNVITAEKMGLGGCKTTIKLGDLLSGIPPSFLQDPANYQLNEVPYTWTTGTTTITESRVEVTVTVPYAFGGLVVQPGNEVTLQTVLPNEAAASVQDFWKYVLSLGGDVSKVWVKYGALDNSADNLAILDVIAPITDWRTGARSTDHLDALRELTMQSVLPGSPAYETIRKIVCESADEAGFKDISGFDQSGAPVTLDKCTVKVNLVPINPNEPNTWYQLDSLPQTWSTTPEQIAQLRPVIIPADFEAYNFDNAYVLYAPEINQSNWWSQVPEALRQYAP